MPKGNRTKPPEDHPFRGEWGLSKDARDAFEQSEAYKRRQEMLKKFRAENTKKHGQQ